MSPCCSLPSAKYYVKCYLCQVLYKKSKQKHQPYFSNTKKGIKFSNVIIRYPKSDFRRSAHFRVTLCVQF